jgi:3-phenylpropionate/cinnamic acid dioxygenase small subunit
MRTSLSIPSYFLLAATLLMNGCSAPPAPPAAAPPQQTTAAMENPDYSAASPEYSTLAATALGHLSHFRYDDWGAMLAEDVEYAFPDGDEVTRTKLVGRDTVVAWWKKWQTSNGIVSMTTRLENHIPVSALIKPQMTGLPGVYVFSYFTNTVSYPNGNTASVRMNFATHFNADKKIDRYYGYYDRTPFIQAQGKNVLEKDDRKAKK